MDIDQLLTIEPSYKFATTLYEILDEKYDEDSGSLNKAQLYIFLCMQIENAGQAGHILNFLQSWYPQYKDMVIEALLDLGAIRSSRLVSQAVQMLPKDDSWFFEKADEMMIAEMNKLDKQFSDYPNGPMRDLYINYVKSNKEEFKDLA